jgi:hypothetical protein
MEVPTSHVLALARHRSLKEGKGKGCGRAVRTRTPSTLFLFSSAQGRTGRRSGTRPSSGTSSREHPARSISAIIESTNQTWRQHESYINSVVVTAVGFISILEFTRR